MKKFRFKKYDFIFFGYSFWAKYGHWCHATPKIALDHWSRGGKIKIAKA